MGVKWLVSKQPFLPILTQLGPTFWPKQAQIYKQNFNFQYLRKAEAILLPIMWLSDWLTKVKTSKIVFCYFRLLTMNYPRWQPEIWRKEKGEQRKQPSVQSVNTSYKYPPIIKINNTRTSENIIKRITYRFI